MQNFKYAVFAGHLKSNMKQMDSVVTSCESDESTVELNLTFYRSLLGFDI